MTSDPETNNESKQQPGNQSMLLDYLAEHDEPCPSCGYNLRQLTQPTCPECGLSLKLSVGSDEPFKRAWAITLCLNAMIAGIGVIFFLLLVGTGDSPPSDDLMLIWFYGPMVWTPVPALLFCFRKWFCRLAKGVQIAACYASGFWLGAIGLIMVIDLSRW